MHRCSVGIILISAMYFSASHASAQPVTTSDTPTYGWMLEAQKLQSTLEWVNARADLYVRLKFIHILGIKSTPCALSALEEAAARASTASAVWREGFEQINHALAEKLFASRDVASVGQLHVLKGAGGLARGGLAVANPGISKFLDRVQSTASFASETMQQGTPSASTALGAIGVAAALGGERFQGATMATRAAKHAVDYSNAASEDDFLKKASAAIGLSGVAGVPGAAPVATAIAGAGDINKGMAESKQGYEAMSDALAQRQYYHALCNENADKRQLKADLLRAIAEDMRSAASVDTTNRLASPSLYFPPSTRAMLDEQASQAVAESCRCVEAAMDQVYPNRDRSKGWNGCEDSRDFERNVDALLDDALSKLDEKGKTMNERVSRDAKSGAAALAAASRAHDKARQQAKALEQALATALLAHTLTSVRTPQNAEGVRASDAQLQEAYSDGLAYDVYWNDGYEWVTFYGAPKAQAFQMVELGRSITNDSHRHQNRIIKTYAPFPGMRVGAERATK